MPFVMVPVPAEHVPAVMTFVVQTVHRATIQDWDAAAMEEFFAGLDEAGKSLLSIVARGVLRGQPLTAERVARFIQLDLRELSAIVRELHDLTRSTNRPPLVVTNRITETLPNGRVREVGVMNIDPQLAELVRTAEQAEHSSIEHLLERPAP